MNAARQQLIFFKSIKHDGCFQDKKEILGLVYKIKVAQKGMIM